jgi:hypothetical protein
MKWLKVKIHLIYLNIELYHKCDKMKSMGVLQSESELMDHIIVLFKKDEKDYDSFESKKDMIEVEIEVSY